MRKPRTATLTILVVLLLGMVAGCGQTTIEIGLTETTEPGRWSVSYETFSGTKSVTAQASSGQTMTLTYDASLNKGTLDISVETPLRETVWEATLHESAKATVEFVLYASGTYSIIAHGSEASGSFDVSWQIQ
jgi:hypothetical protein